MSFYTFRTVVLTVFILALASMAQAQATRTWVSGVGDDANPCSRTAPCKTFNGALGKTATNGEINCLDPGGFGPVSINKSITIDCTGIFGGITGIPAGTNGITIAAAGGVVRLRGFSISCQNTGAYGIRITAAYTVTVENIVIDNCTAQGISLETSTAATLSISNSSIRNNGSGASGVNIAPTGTLSAIVAIINSQIQGNTAGIKAALSDVAVTGCMISGNGIGILAGGNGNIRLSGNTISENVSAMSALAKGVIISYGNNATSGNTQSSGPTQTVGLQ